MASQYPPSLRILLPALILVFEIAFILIFYFFVSYDHPRDLAIYPAFQDVNVMVFFGFGFLLAFLRRYGFSSTGFGLLLAALGAQWAVIVDGFLFHFSDGKVKITLQSLLTAIMSIPTVLISAGAILGKANPVQLILMALIEVTVFATNRWIAVGILQVANHLSLMYVHLFGAYFGLTIAWWLHHPSLNQKVEKETSKPVSHLFAMLGTLFLWMFWPSFNSILIDNSRVKSFAIYNTYFAIASSTIAAFAVSVATSKNGKLSMAQIQNATLAGGVAIGFSASSIQHPWTAMTLGLLAGTISVLASVFFQTCLNPFLGIHDTCGVHSTFGLPSLLGGVAHIILIIAEQWRSSHQSDWGYMALLALGALSLSIVLSFVAGLVTGFLLISKLWKSPPATKYFDDQAYWEFPHLAVGY
ncbi:RH-like protein [Eublepharis macularius]|uniref:RH-like protein n=1 Tax=Eublepharis macularius TaxID=481883 RepID=A0AA97KG33_EUBMA|nr:RH-like protein [Eublepharis macularius]